MRAVVLVGGMGTRLRPLTYTIPKNLLPVVEVPIIERVATWLAGHGVEGIVLSMGYKPDAFASAYPDGEIVGLPVEYAVEPEPLDTGGAIRFAAREANVDDTFLVVNGDVLTDIDLSAQVDLHRRWGAEGTIALTEVDDPSRFGVVVTDPDGRVSRFVEKPPPGEAPSNFINAGAYVLEPSVLDTIAEGVPVSVERVVFPALAARGALYAVPSDAYWLDVGLPDSYLRGAADLLDPTRRAGVPAPGAVEIAPGVWTLGEPSFDGDPADLCGPCTLVGAGAVVARGARVERSVVGAGARVGPGAVVVDSVLLTGVVVDAGARVEGSILGPGTAVGAGAAVQDGSVLGTGVVVDPGAVLRGARLPTGPS